MGARAALPFGGAQQQAGADRLDVAGERLQLRSRIRGCGYSRLTKSPKQLRLSELKWRRGLRQVKRRWPESRTAKPEPLNSCEGRCEHENKAARISIMAGNLPENGRTRTKGIMLERLATLDQNRLKSCESN